MAGQSQERLKKKIKEGGGREYTVELGVNYLVKDEMAKREGAR